MNIFPEEIKMKEVKLNDEIMCIFDESKECIDPEKVWCSACELNWDDLEKKVAY